MCGQLQMKSEHIFDTLPKCSYIIHKWNHILDIGNDENMQFGHNFYDSQFLRKIFVPFHIYVHILPPKLLPGGPSQPFVMHTIILVWIKVKYTHIIFAYCIGVLI